MLRNIEELSPGIYKIDNFISKSSCDFLIKHLNVDLDESPRHHIYGSLGSEYPKYLEIIGNYKEDSSYNNALDLFNSIILSFNSFISFMFKEEHILKQTYYSVMKDGSENTIHIDNYYYDENGDLKIKDGYSKDKSAMLYLSDNYEGGELYFPNQNFSIKPQAGTVIFFEGDGSKPHGVKEVISGERCNIITFFEPRNLNG